MGRKERETKGGGGWRNARAFEHYILTSLEGFVGKARHDAGAEVQDGRVIGKREERERGMTLEKRGKVARPERIFRSAAT